MGEHQTQDGERQEAAAAPAGFSFGRVLGMLALVALGTAAILWFRYGDMALTIERELGISIQWLPALLVPLWALFIIFVVIEVRKAKAGGSAAPPPCCCGHAHEEPPAPDPDAEPAPPAPETASCDDVDAPAEPPKEGQ